MTQTLQLVSFVVACLVSFGLGWFLGSRLSAGNRERLMSEGRADSSVDLAETRTELASAVNTVRRLESERSELIVRLRESAESLNSIQIANGRLSERMVHCETTAASLQKSEQENAAVKQIVVELRELASSLRAQLEAAVSAKTDTERRNERATALESTLRAELTAQSDALTIGREGLARLSAELSGTKDELSIARNQVETLHSSQRELESRNSEFAIVNAQLKKDLEAQQSSANEKLELLINTRESLVDQFKALSSEILEEKSKRFTEQNAASIGALLAPVKEKLTAFQTKVEEVYRTEGQERSVIGEQLRQLVKLNQALSADAQNLTKALKGDQKTQGTWGEIVLDTVLEQAGLVEGTHYERQSSFDNDGEGRVVPDIVLRLPGDRQLVIDAKVSLTAYERGASAQSEEDREGFLRQHVLSVRNQIRVLSEKNYQQLYQIKSLDFVLLFIPIEPAFAAAVSNDNQIFREAWDRNVILVSPSTLLFVVRTVAYLWRQETQAKNVQEIARRGAALYDKLCGFVEELQDVGKRIQQTGKAYDAAVRKLAMGDGNVIRQAEMLRDLGVKPSKQLPIHLVDRALSNVQQNLISEDTLPEGSSETEGGNEDAST
jgi:DNA recombination protein RmuC